MASEVEETALLQRCLTYAAAQKRDKLTAYQSIYCIAQLEILELFWCGTSCGWKFSRSTVACWRLGYPLWPLSACVLRCARLGALSACGAADFSFFALLVDASSSDAMKFKATFSEVGVGWLEKRFLPCFEKLAAKVELTVLLLPQSVHIIYDAKPSNGPEIHVDCEWRRARDAYRTGLSPAPRSRGGGAVQRVQAAERAQQHDCVRGGRGRAAPRARRAVGL